MNNNDRVDSDDDQSTDTNNDREYDIVDHSGRDDTANREHRDDTADLSDHDDTANSGHRDDSVNHSGRDDTANSGHRDDTADSNRRDDTVNHSGRDATANRERRDDTADSSRRDDTANSGHRDDTVNHSGRDTNESHERRNADDDHRYRDDNANRDRRDDNTTRDRRDGNATEGNSGGPGKWLSPLIALLGLWMVAMALVLDVTGSHFWSAVLVGALLVAVGGYNYSRQANERVANSAIALIAVAAGLWLIAAPYVLGGDAGLSESAYDLWFYNHIAVGLLAAGLGIYSAYTSQEHQQDTRQTNA